LNTITNHEILRLNAVKAGYIVFTKTEGKYNTAKHNLTTPVNNIH